MKMWSLIPLLRYQHGHPYSYNRSVGDACAINGWTHVALVPTSCLIQGMPETWEKILPEDYFVAPDHTIIWKTPWQKFKTLIKNIVPWCRVLKKIKADPATSKVIFLEQFFLPQLVVFCLAMLIVGSDAEIWLLHRNHPRKIYAWMHKLLKPKLLTDSELLRDVQAPVYGKNIFVLPIPHAKEQYVAPFDKKELVLWWPGGSTTPAKGLRYIQKLSKRKMDGVRLVVADSAKKHLKAYYVPADMPRDEYDRWMKTADIVLLPYDPLIYQGATSGIFVEAIIAGAIPVTMSGTWMAYELKRFDLSELLVDWNDSCLLEMLKEISQKATIRKKLHVMQKEYQVFHSLQGFARELNHVFTA